MTTYIETRPRPLRAGTSRRRLAGAALLAGFTLAACGGGPVRHHEDEAFGQDARYRREFPAPARQVCDAARAMLMSQGYVVTAAPGGDGQPAWVGSKEFKEEDKAFAVLQVHATCLSAPGRPETSTMYVTAVESHYDVKAKKESSSFGLPLIGPIAFSTTSASESQVKTGGETIRDGRFYLNFFNAVHRELNLPAPGSAGRR